jgi:outer membrane lipoprotein-sorting protein
VIGAIFWEPIPPQHPILIEEADDSASRDYVLTVIRRPEKSGADEAGGDWEIAEKIWFDRADLSIVRCETYDPGGKLASDVCYSGWGTAGTVRYPRRISLARPGNDYKLQIDVTKAAFNETISPDRFELLQPPGSELVNVGEESQEMKPAVPKN